MKNTFKTNIAPIIASLCALAILALPAFAATGPGVAPPGGNVKAGFSSVNASNTEGNGVVGVSIGGVGDGVVGVGGGDGIVDGAGGIGGNFTGKRYGIKSRVNSSTAGVAAGHFVNATSGTTVDLGLPDNAILSQGPVEIKGNLTTDGNSSVTGRLSVTGKSGSSIETGYFSVFDGLRSVSLATPSSAMTAKGDIKVNGDTSITGKLRAAGGIGAFYNGTVGSVFCFSATCTVTSSCTGTDSIVSCQSYSSSGSSNINDQYVYSTNACTVDMNNASGATIESRPRCFNPNG